jgi:hypothetical protein
MATQEAPRNVGWHRVDSYTLMQRLVSGIWGYAVHSSTVGRHVTGMLWPGIPWSSTGART